MKLGAWFLVLFLVAGCMPAGPGALLEGKRLVEQGKYPQAIKRLTNATSLLPTNAQAWNYLGLAYHYSGQATEAESAYQRALVLDRDLTETRFNLGMLYFSQNKFEAARNQLTAYILRRGNSLDGLLRLGAAQWRLHLLNPAEKTELTAAEKSFSDALRLNPKSPEALNGLGLVRTQRGRTAEAAQLFAGALKQQPDYAPALLNLAILAQQYQKDNALALTKYREYLALKPAPEKADQVRAIVRQLEQPPAPPPRAPMTNTALPTNTSRPSTTNAPPAAAPPKDQGAGDHKKPALGNDSPKPAAVKSPSATNTGTPAPTTSFAIEPTAMKTETKNPPKAEPPPVASPQPMPAETVTLAPEPVFKIGEDLQPEKPPTNSDQQPRFLHRENLSNLSRGETRPALTTTPLPPAALSPDRYVYKVTNPPSPGDRALAERSVKEGVRAQQETRLTDALQAFRQAAQQDRAFFDAQYNLGVAAARAGNLPVALSAYETALSIKPDSLDARYNFALALKESNYFADSAVQLQKVLATYPDDARAQLALANLYAQELRQPALAREHYLRVLQVAPGHPQASQIHYWLVANPEQ